MSEIHNKAGVRLIHGNVRDAATLDGIADGSVRTIVTSPPYYGLRDYGEDAQLGAEESVHDYVRRMVEVFAGLRRVLADDGTLWLNLGDSYTGSWGAQGQKGELADRAVVAARGYGGATTRTGSRRPGEPPAKNLLGVPWRVAFALQDEGWFLRSEIIWSKVNAMPESVKDRPSRTHETIFLFAKQPRYFYDADAIREEYTGDRSAERRARSGNVNKENAIARAWDRPQLARAREIAEQKGLTQAHIDAIRAVGLNDTGKAVEVQSGAGKNRDDVRALADEAKAALGGYYREFLSGGTRNKRTVWTVASQPFAGAHFATYPPELIRPCIRAGSEIGDTVLDPFSGSGTTGMVARQEGRNYIGIDVNREYLDLSLRTRFAQPVLDMWGGDAA